MSHVTSTLIVLWVMAYCFWVFSWVVSYFFFWWVMLYVWRSDMTWVMAVVLWLFYESWHIVSECFHESCHMFFSHDSCYMCENLIWHDSWNNQSTHPIVWLIHVCESRTQHAMFVSHEHNTPYLWVTNTTHHICESRTQHTIFVSHEHNTPYLCDSWNSQYSPDSVTHPYLCRDSFVYTYITHPIVKRTS